MKHALPATLIVLLALGLAWMLLFWQPASPPAPTVVEPPQGGDFTLQSYAGPVSLSDFKGKVVVLYFGYTWCPDICPTSLALLSTALDGLTEAERSDVQALFISVDPERDSVDHLKEYGEYFHPRILGITGTPGQLSKVAHQYGAAYRIVRQDSAAGYLVDHSADLYVIDRQGQWVDTIHHGTPAEQIAAVLKKWLAE